MRILLAEEDAALSNAIHAVLRQHNHSIDAVYSGEDAYDYASSAIYDAIILDLTIPKMDGLTVIRKLRREGIATPIIFLTAKSALEDRIEGLDAGADDYMIKPIYLEELMARLRVLARRIPQILPDILSFGNISLDPGTNLLSSGNDAVRLGRKEFQMMELLLRNPNRLISTNHFMQQIWGNDSDTELNVVWVYISYLRKKLRNINANVEIKAARGVGYTLAEIKI
ncbi:MAG: response regulator transcription factor [Christensenellaceae bacterium]|nr:response regulator transcription factor [Christensenellaceae bacterium]